jgi:beta-N-acetylhexosaminidase
MLSREEISQLFMFGFAGKRFDGALRGWLSSMKPGGIIHFARNAGSPAEMSALNRGFAEEALSLGIPSLLIACDQEGGIVNRLVDGFTVFPGNMAMGAIYAAAPSDAIRLCRAAAETTALEMKATGFNMNLAPCVDVASNHLNPTIGTRSYSDRPGVVGALASAAASGFAAGGVLATAKHFPGHGDTPVDSHTGLPTGVLTPEYTMTHIAPFRTLIEQGVPVVMPAHIAFANAGERPGLPATLSREMLTGYLRGRLGFSGLIITDCMEMAAIADTFGTAAAAVTALSAGADMVLISHTQPVQREAILLVEQALADGRLDERELRAKLRRIRVAKELAEKVPATGIEVCGSDAHEALAKDIARRSVVVLKRDFVPKDASGMLLVAPERYGSTIVEDLMASPLIKAVRARGIAPEVISYGSEIGETLHDAAVEAARRSEWVLFASTGLLTNSGLAQMARDVLRANNRMVLLSTGAPYDVGVVPEAPVVVLSFGYAPCQLEAALSAVFTTGAAGRLPVDIPGFYAAGSGVS